MKNRDIKKLFKWKIWKKGTACLLVFSVLLQTVTVSAQGIAKGPPIDMQLIQQLQEAKMPMQSDVSEEGQIVQSSGEQSELTENGQTDQPSGNQSGSMENGQTGQPSGDQSGSMENGQTDQPSGDQSGSAENGQAVQPSGDQSGSAENGQTDPSSDQQSEDADLYENGIIKIYNIEQLQAIGTGSSVRMNDTEKELFGTGEEVVDGGNAVTYASDADYMLMNEIPLTAKTMWTLPEGFTGTFAEAPKEDAPLYDKESDTVYVYNNYQLLLIASENSAEEPIMSYDMIPEKVGIGQLLYGYYLVYQTGTKEIQSSLVSVDDVDVTVNLKGQAPSIDKTANATTVEIGQVVTYTIKGTIPDTTGYDKYTYKIHDTLTEGLDFVKDAVGTAQEGTSYNVSVKIGEGQAETKAATLSGENNRIMTLDLSEWIRNNQNSKGQEFTVTYYAKVNADAVVQTNNSAHLEYGNDPDNITTTTPDVVTTPTYPVQIHKLIKDQQNSYLAGAIFRLYRSEEDANNNQNAIAVTGSNGTYTVDPEQVGDNKMYDMESIGDGTTVGTGMNLKLNGLAEGSYWLVETQAPDGYNKLTAPVKITITKSDTTNVNDWTIKQNDGVVDDKIIDIENTTGTLLPETGGMGTVIFTVIAVVMILGIAVSFVISRRKRA